MTELAVLGKEIMTRTSAQEHLEIQAQVDRMLKRWKFVLSQLAAQRDKFNRERLTNNVNYMSHWLDENHAKARTQANLSEREDLVRAAEALRAYEQDSIPEKAKQMDKLGSSSSISPEVLRKLRTKFDTFSSTVPRRRQDLEAGVRRLDSLTSRLQSVQGWVDQTAARLEHNCANPNTTVVKQNAALEKLRQSLADKEREVVDGLFKDFEALERQVASDGFNTSDELANGMAQLRSDWKRLCARCQKPQRLSGGEGASSASASISSSSSSPRVSRQSASTPAKTPRKYHPNAPQIFAALRDHRDWIRRKNGQLAALRLAGSVDSLQKQAEEHKAFRSVSDYWPLTAMI